MASSIPLKISLRSILNFWHSVDWERTGRWPIFNNDQFTLLYEFDTLQIIYSTKWQHLYWVRYKILNNIKLSPSQLCLSRISVLGIDTPYSIYVELINYFGEKGFKILNTTPRLLETGEDFCFVPFLTSMIPF